jgi:hypothetical protein
MWRAGFERVLQLKLLDCLADNHHSNKKVCIHYDKLQALLVSADSAWELKNEGTLVKPKWGYMSTTPGSTIKVRAKEMGLL